MFRHSNLISYESLPLKQNKSCKRRRQSLISSNMVIHHCFCKDFEYVVYYQHAIQSGIHIVVSFINHAKLTKLVNLVSNKKLDRSIKFSSERSSQIYFKWFSCVL